MPNALTMQVDVEPSASASGRWDAQCGPYEIRGTRTPLLTMARKLLENGEDPDVELRMVHRGSGTIAMRVRIGDAAKIDVREGPVRFVKYDPSKDSG
jgi:hypothetical protein